MNPIQSLHVDGQPTQLSAFAVPEMDLSSKRIEMARRSFTVAAKATDLVEFLEPAYAAWVAESKRDDETCGGPRDELAEAGYPKFQPTARDPFASQARGRRLSIAGFSRAADQG